jgi:hypothetical protein
MEENKNIESIVPIDPKPSQWMKDHERILIDWADKAMCYRWLHAKSHTIFNKVNTYFTIPVIIMSTLTGTANFAAERVPEQYRGYYSMIIGFVNILAGIITTIQQFLKISELNEAHRVSSISWDKFYRRIKVELSKPPFERQNIYDFLKACTEEFDRLMETSPTIDKQVIELFNKTFNGTKLDANKKKLFDALKKPEICDSLESVQFSVYKEDESAKKEKHFKTLITDLVTDLKKNTEDEMHDSKYKIIDEFINNFKSELLRMPTKEELLNNLDSQELGITREIILKYISEKIEDNLFDTIEQDLENNIQLNRL